MPTTAPMRDILLVVEGLFARADELSLWGAPPADVDELLAAAVSLSRDGTVAMLLRLVEGID